MVELNTNGKSAMERHFQTIVQVALIAIILWFGNKTTSTSDAVIRLEGTLVSQALQIDALRADFLDLRAAVIAGTSDRYRKADADNAAQLIELQHEIYESRFTSIERRIQIMEEKEMYNYRFYEEQL